MKIYLDYIFLENIIVNAVIIIETIKLINLDISKLKIGIYIFVDSIISVIIYINPELNTIFYQILFSSLMIIIFFKPKNIYNFLKYLIVYNLIYIIFMGVIIVATIILNINLENYLIKIMTYLFSAIILHYLIQNLWIMWKTKIQNSDLLYKLIINNVEISSFIDTGNKVKDPITKLSVIFLKKNLEDKINLDNCKRVYFNVSTVNGIEIKEGYIITNVKVEKDKKEVAIISKIILCFSLNDNISEKYSSIIGYDTYLEYLNGGVGY